MVTRVEVVTRVAVTRVEVVTRVEGEVEVRAGGGGGWQWLAMARVGGEVDEVVEILL